LQTGIRKRRRKALSCYECRRRKVKCDRGAPSCNRCKETGQAGSCSYTLDAPARGIDEDPSVSADEPLVSQPRRPDALSPTANVSDDILSILKQQARRIAQLEDKLARSDALPSREWKGLEQFVAGPRLSMAENSMSKMQIYIEEQEQKEPETIPTRGGRGFETKFYGASNSTSLISHVCSTLTPLSLALILVVS
jgi:Fungal Zn(2)-Cys(6) binuclear cluster domain